ncbi:hypothetical protein GCM10027598_01670 [Amycolatopsis oliviviridis]|uniref:Peptidase M16 N-terminal domain-containing protein n=1 Tax=Amycolatopsis oliviviridis TaxID=1471590 RepID=A0ABQ3LPR3_9PSEU|nr:insulinase family protein [Amycolatopsis oliviviridis]GHH22450.1 hypothetical protein GCM10017790_44210 [Amycolatopsis oliviviridis]
MTEYEEVQVAGLLVRFVPAPGAHTVGACLRVSAGSAADPPRPWGTAHLTEHLRIAAALDDGSRLHLTGRTDNAETRFTVAALPEQEDEVVRTLARLLGDGRPLDDSVLAAERQAVLLEMRAAAANPLLLLGPAVAEATVPGGRMADTTRADQASVGGITLDDVEGFTAEHYRPENALLAVAAPPAHRKRLLDTVSAALKPSETPVASGDGEADRPPITLPSTVDGLSVLTLTVALDDHVGRSAVRALAFAEGPIGTRTARAGHPTAGMTTVTDGKHEVTVLCWRDEKPDGGLRDALATAFAAIRRADPDVVESWHYAAVREFQELAFARVSPLGLAQAALLPPPPSPGAHTMAGELRRAIGTARSWRVRAGTPHAEEMP